MDKLGEYGEGKYMEIFAISIFLLKNIESYGIKIGLKWSNLSYLQQNLRFNFPSIIFQNRLYKPILIFYNH